MDRGRVAMVDGLRASALGSSDDRVRHRKAAIRLAGLSLLTLFVELALIRWTTANNVYLVSVTNFVLLASFLGIGCGFLLAQIRWDLLRVLPFLFALIVLFVLVFPVRLASLRGPGEFRGLDGARPIPEWLSLSVLFALTTALMAGFGQTTARAFSMFRALDAYRYDIIGSIGGIALFSILSFIGLPPLAWGTVAVLGIGAVLGRSLGWQHVLFLAIALALLTVESLSIHDTWSPYYKVTAVPKPHDVLEVSGNNVPYQTVYPIAKLRAIEPFYFFPYRHVLRPERRSVLVIGAGTGNDVGVALAEGARHVDAVEIDPVLVALGRRYNPEHAYESPRVRVHINDGRAFLENSSKRWSLIIYALPDSLSALSGQAAPVGLENYLLTEQAVAVAKSHLARGGTFVMYNYYQPWLLDRYATELERVFGRPPCVELGASLGNRRQAVLTESLSGPVRACASTFRGNPARPATDNWPYPYLRGPGIPLFYLEVLGAILAASLAIVVATGARGRHLVNFADLFFMGAAFMLIETKNIVQFALYFGTTWYVNSLVFTGVLVAIYAAVEVARHVRLPKPGVLYVALFGSLALAWAVPAADILSLSWPLRFAAAAAVAFLPIFLANLVFAERFGRVGSSTAAFGANLLGAIVGGALEYLSLMVGFSWLLLVAACCYAIAFVIGPAVRSAARA